MTAWGEWRLTRGGAIALTVGVGLLAVGLALGQWPVAILGVAPVTMVAFGLSRRPERAAEVSPGDSDLSRDAWLRTPLLVSAPAGVDAVWLHLNAPDGREQHLLVAPGRQTRSITVAIRTLHAGPQEIYTLDYRSLVAGRIVESPILRPPTRRQLVLPQVRPLDLMPLPPRLPGLTGAHHSPRAGDGGELRDIHPFTPGDRLRRIDWKATARHGFARGDLYVRRTHATADATAVIVIDSRDDIGPDPRTWSGVDPIHPLDLTSLDLAREAVASIAAQYITTGDRVGLEDLGRDRPPIRPAGGRRQLQRIRHRLAIIEPLGTPRTMLRPPPVPATALVFMVSTFLDAEAGVLAAGWFRAGHRVVAVDVLPEIRRINVSPQRLAALGIVLAERAERIDELRALGVELVRWGVDGASPRAAAFRAMARRRIGSGGRR